MAEPSASSVLNASAAPRTNNVHQNKNVYELLNQKINQGKSSTTRVYKRKRNERLFVSTNRPYGDKALHEIEILTALDGLPGIISLEDFEEYSINNRKFIKIYTPYKKGDLITFLLKNKKEINENIILDIFKQIIEAVIGMHTKSICHLDLKLENIVIDENHKIYIIDFESAKKVDESGNFTFDRIFGTPMYLPKNVNDIFDKVREHYATHRKIPEGIKFNGYILDLYAVYIIMRLIVQEYNYMVKEIRKKPLINMSNLDYIFEFIFEFILNYYRFFNYDIFTLIPPPDLKSKQILENLTPPDLKLQEKILKDIKTMIANLEQPTTGGYKKPRRKIHKQYTRKRRTNKS